MILISLAMFIAHSFLQSVEYYSNFESLGDISPYFVLALGKGKLCLLSAPISNHVNRIGISCRSQNWES